MRENILYVVIPCYNEEEVLPETARQLKEKMTSLMERGLIARDSRIVFVNDGSKDRTWPIIRELHEQDPLYAGVNLTPEPGPSERPAGGPDDGKGRLRYHHFH